MYITIITYALQPLDVLDVEGLFILPELKLKINAKKRKMR